MGAITTSGLTIPPIFSVNTKPYLKAIFPKDTQTYRVVIVPQALAPPLVWAYRK